jgi:hypothetical protein
MHHDTGKASSVGPVAAAVGGLLVVVGSFLTWATLTIDATSFGGQKESQSVQGFDASDGKISLAIGVILIVAGLVAMRSKAAGGRRGMGILAIVGGLAAIGLGIFEVMDIKNDLDALVSGLGLPDGVASHSIGIGLWIIIAGGLIGLVGGVLSMTSAKAMPAAAGTGFTPAPPAPGAMTPAPPAGSMDAPPPPAGAGSGPGVPPPPVPEAPAPTTAPEMPASGAMGTPETPEDPQTPPA